LVLRPIVGAIIVAADVLPLEMTVTMAITSAGQGNIERATSGKEEKSSRGPDARTAAPQAWVHPTPWHFLPDPPSLRHV